MRFPPGGGLPPHLRCSLPRPAQEACLHGHAGRGHCLDRREGASLRFKRLGRGSVHSARLVPGLLRSGWMAAPLSCATIMAAHRPRPDGPLPSTAPCPDHAQCPACASRVAVPVPRAGPEGRLWSNPCLPICALHSDHVLSTRHPTAPAARQPDRICAGRPRQGQSWCHA